MAMNDKPPTHRFHNHSTAFGLVRSTEDNVDMDLNGDNTANRDSRAMDCAIAPYRVIFPDLCMSMKKLESCKETGIIFMRNPIHPIWYPSNSRSNE